jgi:hypothetical protein
MAHFIISFGTEYRTSLGNMVLRKIFEPKWAHVLWDWRRLHSEELNALYSASIIRVIKTRRMKWEGH